MVTDVAPSARESTSLFFEAGEAASRMPHHGRQVTLIDVLDRLLAGGVVIAGHITLAVADIDLVDLDLGVILASTDKLAGQ